MKFRCHLIGVALVASTASACGFSADQPVTRVRIERGNHTEIFPISSGAHDGADCNACHGTFDTFTMFSCIIACHAQAECVSDHNGIPGFVYDDTSCYGCHPDGQGTSREAHQLMFPIVGAPHGEIGCSECHPSDYGSFACTNCHEHLCVEMDSKHDEVSGYQCVSVACKNCHPTGVNND